jgi:hypothetical protein
MQQQASLLSERHCRDSLSGRPMAHVCVWLLRGTRCVARVARGLARSSIRACLEARPSEGFKERISYRNTYSRWFYPLGSGAHCNNYYGTTYSYSTIYLPMYAPTYLCLWCAHRTVPYSPPTHALRTCACRRKSPPQRTKLNSPPPPPSPSTPRATTTTARNPYDIELKPLVRTCADFISTDFCPRAQISRSGPS